MKTLILAMCLAMATSSKYQVSLSHRDSEPTLSYLVKNNTVYRQVFNPTWVSPSEGTNHRKGLLARTQDCSWEKDKCIYCGGAASKASLLTLSEEVDGHFTPITKDSISFTPSSFEDSWGTEDPRMAYN